MSNENARLIDRLAAFPDWVASRSADIPAAHRTWKPEGAEFCWTEQLCHLRDVEREGNCVRIGRIVEEDKPTLLGVDGARLAAERKYIAQDPAYALQTFRTFRQLSTAMLRTASATDLERRGTYGPPDDFSLTQLVETMIEHDSDHRGQIESLIADGRRAGLFGTS